MVLDNGKWNYAEESAIRFSGDDLEAWKLFRRQVSNYLQIVLDFCTSKYQIQIETEIIICPEKIN